MVVIRHTVVMVRTEEVNTMSSQVKKVGVCVWACAQECHLMLFLILPRLRSVRLLEDLGVFTTSAQPLEMLRLAGAI